MIGVRIGKRIAPVIGACIGIGADELGGGNANPMAGVTQDASSGMYTPNTAAEVNTWLAASATSGAASLLYRCQEVSGNLIDQISGVTLTVAGAPSYGQTIAGWARKFIQMTDGASQNFSSTSASLPNIATTSFLIFYWAAFTSTPAATRNACTMGTTTAAMGPNSSGPTMRVISNAGTQNGLNNLPTSVILCALKCDRTNSVVTGYTLQDKITPTFGSAMTGQKFTIGPTAASSNAPPMAIGWLVGFFGSAAEKADPTVKTMMQKLGANPTWT